MKTTLTPYTHAIQTALYAGARPTLLPAEEPANGREVAFDAEVARTSYERFAGVWSKIPTAGLSAPRVDVDYVSGAVLQRAREIQSPGMRERFAKLPEFDIACYDDLEGTAWAVWYCNHQRATVRTKQTYGQVPAALWQRADALDAKMVRVLEYNAVNEDDADDPVAKGLRALTHHKGNRYERLAHRLMGLADLYEDKAVARMLAQDGKRYSADDAGAARGFAAQITLSLNVDKKDDAFWTTQLTRAWTALERCYAQVRRGMLFLDADHGAEERFLKIRSYVRPAERKPEAPKPAAENATKPTADAGKKKRKSKKTAAPANDTAQPVAPEAPKADAHNAAPTPIEAAPLEKTG